jgi:hypothetical protein
VCRIARGTGPKKRKTRIFGLVRLPDHVTATLLRALMPIQPRAAGLLSRSSPSAPAEQSDYIDAGREERERGGD